MAPFIKKHVFLVLEVDYTIGGHKIDEELERHFLASLKGDNAVIKGFFAKLRVNQKLAAQLRRRVVSAKESHQMNKHIEVNVGEETFVANVSQAKYVDFKKRTRVMFSCRCCRCLTGEVR